MADKQNAGKSGRIVAGVMSFLLSLMLLFAVMLPALYFTALSPLAFTGAFKSVDFYERVYEHSLEKAGDLLLPTGLPSTVLEGVLTVDDIEDIARGKVNGSITAEDISAIAAGMQERMLENVYAYMDAEGIPRDIISTEELENIVLTVTNEFESLATFPFINRLRSYFSLYLKLMVIGVIVCVGLAVVLSKLIKSLTIWNHVYWRNMAFATGGTALMLLALPIASIAWGGYTRIGISPEYLFLFVQKIIGNSLFTLIALGVLALAITVVLACLSEKGRERARGRKHKRPSQPEAFAGLPDV